MEPPPQRTPLLCEPTVRAKTSYLEALNERRALGEQVKQRPGLDAQFEEWVRFLHTDAHTDTGKVDGWVPQHTFWLLDGDHYIGEIRIRTILSDTLRIYGGNIGYAVRPSERRRGHATRMLAMALEKARDFGLSEVLLTCDDDNVASQKTIEANGGRHIDTLPPAEGRTKPHRRYVIRIGDKPE